MLPGRILCIDDEELGLLVRKMTLEAEGYEVTIAPDGPSGLQLFASQPFDLVLLDHSMPGMNGGQVAEEIRLRSPGTPIVLLSAYVTLPEEHIAMVDAYITKGESTDLLLTTIHSLIEKAKRGGLAK
jgi:CheY-like chemotaxis protein